MKWSRVVSLMKSPSSFELAVYLVNSTGPVPLVCLRITHERWGSNSMSVGEVTLNLVLMDSYITRMT